jgi:hypothetical protein
MSELELWQSYLAVAFGRFFDRAGRDERGYTVETLVWIGISALAVVAVAGILWAKLRSGANNVNVPAPAAP